MTKQFLYIKNFEKWQHYKDRCPPWIKLHRDILNDYDFSCLQDASKAHLIQIWLLASQMNNKLPFDSKWVANKINATDTVDLKLLINKGFLFVDSEVLADCKQSALVETETETETETEDTLVSLPPTCPHAEIVSAYNQTLKMLPQVKVKLWNGARKKNLATRWKEDKERQSIEWWQKFFRDVGETPFLVGKNNNGWKADLGWLVKSSNIVKVLEGNYKDDDIRDDEDGIGVGVI